jgi:CRP/FNR family transcriptional regulator, cyclic AMP receptor protein
MIPLRALALMAHICFIIYGIFAGAFYVLLAYGITLPFNVWRLVQMKRLVSNVKTAADADLAVRWLHPFMKERPYKAGQAIFTKGDDADYLYFIAKGRVRIAEINEELVEGHLLGEIGFFSLNQKRTLTAVCVDDCLLYRIGASEFKQLYYQNPEFGFYIVNLIARRLSADIERLRESLPPPPADMAV